MVARPFETSTRKFPTQGAARAFYSDILGQYQIGDRVSKPHKTELMALLALHPENAEKVGAGVDYIFVNAPGDPEEKPKMYKSAKCFWVRRVDGSADDFSIKSCFAA